MNSDQAKKKNTLKFLLKGCGIITVLMIAAFAAAVWLLSGQGDISVTPYHPFRSTEAKERYLKLYDEKAKKWPVASETMMVNTSYGQTFVRISGPAGAPPLVLLHGAGGNSLQWMPNVKELSANYRVYAIDNIYDNGRSVYTRALKSPDDLVAWLDESFNALELGDKINIVGLSYGGWLTSQYALRFPHRIDKIVLLAPAGTVLPLSYGWITRAVLCAVPHRHFTKSFLYWLLEDLAKKDEAGRALIEEHVDESFLALRSFKAKRMIAPTVLTDAELLNSKSPTLFLVGENEKIYPAREALQRLKKVAPRINAEIIPNAGHDLTIVQAKVVNGKILEFLQKP